MFTTRGASAGTWSDPDLVPEKSLYRPHTLISQPPRVSLPEVCRDFGPHNSSSRKISWKSVTWYHVILDHKFSRALVSHQIAPKFLFLNHKVYLSTRFQGIYRTPSELREKLVGKVLHVMTGFRVEDSLFEFWTRTQSPVRHTLSEGVRPSFWTF